jgi:hypothetical protein
MIQSIQAGNTAIYNSTKNVLGGGKVSVSEEKPTSTIEQNEDETTMTSVQGDTLTISNAGAQQAAKAQVADVVTETTTEDNYTDSLAAAISSAASSVGITEYTATQNANSADSAAISSGSSSSSTSSDSDLSEYSEYELKTMLQNGEITQAEYNAEIASRQKSETVSDEQSENSAVTGANQTEA